MTSNLWKKIVVGILLLGLGFYGVLAFLGSNDAGLVPPRFIERRNEVAELLKKLASTPDTDLTSLGTFEQKRDFVGALNALEEVTKANDELTDLIQVLVSKTDTIIAEAGRIDDIILRPQALGALSELQKGNRLMLDYFKLRADLFLKLKTYYSDLVIKGEGVSPPNISVETRGIDEHIAQAREAYEMFNKKIDVFDRAAGLKYR